MKAKKSTVNLTKAVALASAVGIVGATEVRAQSELVLTSGASTTGIILGVGGVASYNGSVGGWNVNVTTGLADPAEAPGAIDLNSIDFTGTGAPSPLVILWSAAPYTSTGTYEATLGGTISPGLTATFSSYYGGLLDTSTPLTAPIVTSGSPFAGTSFGTASGPAPFAITEEAVISGTTTDPYSLASFDYNVQAVPEPSIVGLLMAGGASLLVRRVKGGKTNV